MEEKNALQIAGDQIVSDATAKAKFEAGLDLGLWIGRSQSMQLIKAVSDVAHAKSLKHVKDNRIYQQTGMKWEKFCPLYLGISHVTANEAIKNLDAFGESYFAVTKFVPMSPATYGLIAGKIDERGIEIDGKMVPFSAANAPRIKKAVDEVRKEAAAAKREAEAATVKAEKAVQERDNAKKAAIEATRKLRDVQHPAPFAGASENLSEMIRIHSEYSMLCRRYRALRSANLTEDEQHHYVGLFRNMQSDVTRSGEGALEAFPRPLDMPDDPFSRHIRDEMNDLDKPLTEEFLTKAFNSLPNFEIPKRGTDK